MYLINKASFHCVSVKDVSALRPKELTIFLNTDYVVSLKTLNQLIQSHLLLSFFDRARQTLNVSTQHSNLILGSVPYQQFWVLGGVFGPVFVKWVDFGLDGLDVFH